MNKNIIIAIVVVIVILLGLGGFLMMSKSKPATTSTSTEAKPTTNPNTFSSIQDALARSLSLQCDITTSTGSKVTSYIKSGMIRADITGSTPAESSSMIMKDKKIYFWNKTSAFVMAVPSITVTPSAQDKSAGAATTLSTLEQYKNSCKPATVTDSLFVIPTNVKFQDLSSMMAPSGIMKPSGTQVVPSGMTQQQIQDAMKKYQQPSQ